MSTWAIFKLILAVIAVAAIIKTIVSSGHKKKYDKALLEKSSKGECIELGRKYYRSLTKQELQSKKITDIESTINNDLAVNNIA